MKIVFLDASTVGDTPLDEIAALGELVCYPASTKEEALERVGDCEVLIINKVVVDAALIAAAPELRLICEAATGVNNIDLEAAAARGIPVRNVAGYSTDSVVQETFMHILSLAGNGPYFDDKVKSGAYSRGPIFTDLSRPFYELTGKTMGIIGLGTIGTKVAHVAEAFGMKVVYFSTSGTSHNKDYPSLPLDELMATADVISVHAPYNARTAGLVGARELALMKPSGSGSWQSKLYRFLGDTGGFDQKFKAIPMTWKDAALYLLLLLTCAILVTLVIWALGKLFRGLREGRRKKKVPEEIPEQED